MVESIIRQDPSWAGYWLPAFAHCAGYFRVRDQATGVVIANISQSCNRAFASAVRVVADGGMDRLVIFGTGWDRSVSPWVGPCSAAATCAIDAFSSSDPSLAVWQAATPLLMPNGSTYNVGVVRVTVPQPGALAGAQWVMQTEGRAPTFFVCAGGDPAAPGCWTPLPADAFALDHFAGRDIGSCPSIRFDSSTQLFYVLTGGDVISVLRSATLARGSWALGGTLLAPDADDCILAGPPYGGWYTPDANASAHLASCGAKGFGDDSDVDLTEVVFDGEIATLIQYGSGDQKSFGFSNLALAKAPMFELLGSMFAAAAEPADAAKAMAG